MMPEGNTAKLRVRHAARLFGSFKPLIIAWAAFTSVAAILVVGLQVMGPPHPGPKLAPVTAVPSRGPVATGASPAAALHAVNTPAAITPPATAPSSAKIADIAGPRLAPVLALKPPLPEGGPRGPAPPLALSGKLIPEPEPAMLESTAELPDQKLPRISAEGRRAEQVYAASFSPDERHPRVAIVMDGMGLDRGLSEHAMQALPAAIDFAYSAYAPGLTASALATEGRRQGRECLVSLPMEPSGYPLADEGTKSMLTGAESAMNRQNMQAALAHVQGCVGATGASDGMSGERFAGMVQDFTDVLTELSKRGLLYLDPRENMAAPRQDALTPRTADVVVDRATDTRSAASPEAIDARLAALERRAAERGTAIGVAGPPTPMLIERLAVWSNSLAAHGVVLAPLTAIAKPEPARPLDEVIH